jgi:EmrB/QacA subfamily drug resistance transporter
MVMLNSVSTAMMLTGVNVALPNIAHELAIDAILLTWIPMSYLMASAACVLTFGRLADMYGRKRIYLLGTAGVIATSVLAAFSDNASQLIVGRLLQGVFAAMLYATNVAVISSVAPPKQRGAAIGYTVSAIYLGLALGPLLAGFFVEYVSWRWTFILHVPLALLVLYIGLRYIPLEWKGKDLGKFDVLGAASYALSVVCLIVGLSFLPDVIGVGLVLTGLFGLVWFYRHELKERHPVFDVRLFYTSRVFTVACFASMVMYTTTFANVVLISLYLQYLKDVGPIMVGCVLMLQPTIMTVFSPIAGRLSDRIQPRMLALIGMSITGFSHSILSTLDSDTSMMTIGVCMVLNGVGFSLFSSPNANSIMGAIGRKNYGRAGSAIAVMRVFGQMSSMALVSLVFTLVIGARNIEPFIYPELTEAIQTCFAIGACLSLLFVLVTSVSHKKAGMS